MKSLRPTLSAFAIFAALLVAGCGGGGGGSSVPPVGSTTPPASTPQPTIARNQVLGEDVDIATETYGNTIAYDQADGVVVIDSGGTLAALTLTSGFPYVPPSQQIQAVAFDAKTQQNLVSTGTAIYAITHQVPTLIANGFTSVYDMTVDPSGNIFVIDNDHVAEVVNGVPKQITPPGSFPIATAIVSINPLPNWAHIAFDTKDGNLYVADPSRDTIDRVSTSGVITPIAGSCVTGQSQASTGDCAFAMLPGTGTNVIFGVPEGIVYDPNADALYLADGLNAVIWSVTASGTATILAGYGSPGFSGAGGSANGRYALYDGPYALALSSSTGLLYIREYDWNPDVVDSLALVGSPAPMRQFPVTTYWLPSHHQMLVHMSEGLDGSAWFASQNGNYLANVTASGAMSEYHLPLVTTGTIPAVVASQTVTVDPAGYIWTGVGNASTNATDTLLQFTSGGAVTPYTVPASPVSVTSSSIADTTLGPDGNIWYAQATDYGGSIGSITDAGVVTQYPLPNQTLFAPRPLSLGTGPDGNLWYILAGGGQTPVLGRITPQGQYLTPYSIDSTAFRLVPDVAHARVWYIGAAGIGYMNAAGVATPYSLGCSANCSPTALAIGLDGTPWVVEAGYSDVAHVEASGTVVRYLMPFEAPGLMYILSRSDGTFWVDSNIGALFLFNPSAYDSDGLPYRPALTKRPGTMHR